MSDRAKEAAEVTCGECGHHEAAHDEQGCDVVCSCNGFRSVGDDLLRAAEAIYKEFINNDGTDSAFASCMTEVSCYTKNKEGRAMWKKWMALRSAIAAERKRRGL